MITIAPHAGPAADLGDLPCRTGDPDRYHVRDLAPALAAQCATCPALRACRRLAEDSPLGWADGLFGGVWRDTKPGRVITIDYLGSAA